MSKIVQELGELDQQLEGKSLGWRDRVARWCIPIRPFTSNRDAAPCWLAQDQRLRPANTSSFENRETLSAKGMKGVTHLSPSQRLFVDLGSPL